MVQSAGPVGLDAVEVVFDDENAVANAGVALVATLAQRLGIEQLAEEGVDLAGRAGSGHEGAKGHDVGVGDGSRRRLHRRHRCVARRPDRRGCSGTA